jgi:hypothetical protein
MGLAVLGCMHRVVGVGTILLVYMPGRQAGTMFCMRACMRLPYGQGWAQLLDASRADIAVKEESMPAIQQDYHTWHLAARATNTMHPPYRMTYPSRAARPR